jgi:hypothetical protein
MSENRQGLSTTEDILDTAEALTAFADAAQNAVKERFYAKEVSQIEAQELFITIGSVRAIANTLYISAAKSVVADLAEAQKSILGTIGGAEKAIAKIQKVNQIVDLVADVLALAVSINAAKPGPILSSLKEVVDDVQELAVRQV